MNIISHIDSDSPSVHFIKFNVDRCNKEHRFHTDTHTHLIIPITKGYLCFDRVKLWSRHVHVHRGYFFFILYTHISVDFSFVRNCYTHTHPEWVDGAQSFERGWKTSETLRIYKNMVRAKNNEQLLVPTTTTTSTVCSQFHVRTALGALQALLQLV